MQSNSELHEIELHAVESINDLHCTNSNQEAAKPDLGNYSIDILWLDGSNAILQSGFMSRINTHYIVTK